MAPHHLLDILDPHQMFTVVDFRNRALKLIEDLTGEGKIPIIVGGTNYYIESIVYNILVENMDDGGALLWDKSRRKRDFDKTDIGNESDASQAKQLALDAKTSDDHNKVIEAHTSNELEINKDENVLEIDKNKVKEDYDNEEQFTNEEIHEKLKAIDPAMASRLHPNNRRKVLRSIEVWLKTGRRHSEVLDAQKLSEGKLRRPGATIVFWLKCEESVHSQRLDARVDSMLQDGLVEELLDFHDRHNRHRIQDGKPPDYTKGVFQTLGFKEFHEYLMLSEEQRSTEEGKSLLKQSIENMKLGTRRYARRQNKMVKGRFINHPDREVPPIYELDTTELTKWDAEVKTKAIKIIESFLSGAHCEYDPVKSTKEKDTKAINSQSSNYCDICKRLIIGDKEFAIHLNSNRHQKVLKNKRKFEKKEDPESLEKTDS